MTQPDSTEEDCFIVNGDSREWASIIATNGPINCIITDPPYGVAFKSGSAQTAEGKKWVEEIIDDEDVETAIASFRTVMAPLLEATADDCDLYVFTSSQVLAPWLLCLETLHPAFVYKNIIVWDKGTPGMGDLEGNWANSHELIIYLKKGRRPIASRRSSIIAVDRTPSSQHIHPTEKPVALLEVLIEQSTSKGDLIVDPYAGSGSCILAARRLGRRAIGIEKHKPFYDRAVARLDQNFFDL